jgi:hypothetical protein
LHKLEFKRPGNGKLACNLENLEKLNLQKTMALIPLSTVLKQLIHWRIPGSFWTNFDVLFLVFGSHTASIMIAFLLLCLPEFSIPFPCRI